MARPEIIKKLKEKNPQLSKSEIEIILDTFCKSIEIALKQNRNIELRGFGTFFIKKIKEKYSARNPKTGETIYTPEKKNINFKMSKELFKIINEK